MIREFTSDLLKSTTQQNYHKFLMVMLIPVFIFTGCMDNQLSDGDIFSEESITIMESGTFDTSTEDLLKQVKRATARFNSTTQAIRAGYLPDDHCAAIPGVGGMGYHWVNPDFIFGNGFDPLQPEALLYEADKNGNLKLVGVEYIVIDEEQGKPSFGDHPFDDAGAPPLDAQGIPNWTLHVWLYKDNPEGIFEPWNPNVSCPEVPDME